MVNPSTAFLSSLGNSKKQLIQNVILKEIRSQASMPTDLTALMGRVRQRLRSRESETWAVDMLRLFDQHPEEALALLAHNVERQALPPEEKKRLKEQAATIHQRDYMSKQDPTEDQRTYLRDLGHEGPISSRLHAHDLIDQIRKAGHN